MVKGNFGLRCAFVCATTVAAAGVLNAVNVTTYKVPSAWMACAAWDGNVWVTMTLDDKVARISPSGDILTLDLPQFSAPRAITMGPDGAVWGTMSGGLFRIDVASLDQKYVHLGVAVYFFGITVGWDQNLYVTDPGGDRVGRYEISTERITYFQAPDPDGVPQEIQAGWDGNIWFTYFSNKGRIGMLDINQEKIIDFPTGINVHSLIWVYGDPDLWFGMGPDLAHIDHNGKTTVVGLNLANLSSWITALTPVSNSYPTREIYFMLTYQNGDQSLVRFDIQNLVITEEIPVHGYVGNWACTGVDEKAYFPSYGTNLLFVAE